MHRFYLNRTGRSAYEEGVLDGMLIAILGIFALIILAIPIFEIISAVRYMLGVPEDICQMGSLQFIIFPTYLIGSRVLHRNVLDYMYPMHEEDESVRKEYNAAKTNFSMIKMAVILFVVSAVLLIEIHPVFTGMVDIVFTIISCLCFFGAFFTSI